MAQKEVWRLVGGMAVRCTECSMNEAQSGSYDICLADNETCVFTHQHVERQEPWDDFHDLYAQIDSAEETK